MEIREAVLDGDAALTPYEEGQLDGYSAALELVYYHIAQLRYDLDHIKEAVQALDVLRDNISEDTK